MLKEKRMDQKNERIEQSQYSDDKLNYDLIDSLT